jgi:hypothetical protein
MTISFPDFNAGEHFGNIPASFAPAAFGAVVQVIGS